MFKKWVVIGFFILAEIILIGIIIPGPIVWISFAIGAVTASYFLYSASRSKRGRVGTITRRISILPLLSLLLPIFFGWLTYYLGYLSLVTAILATALTIDFFSNFLFFPLSLYHKYLEMKMIGEEMENWPQVSVIVPAHNEEKVIEKSLEALLEVDYPRKEIIVVDDGSTDATYALASGFQSQGVKVFKREESGGKAAALNMGLLFSRGEIIFTCDADSIMNRKALKTVVKHFRDPDISAVAGNVKVLNRNNLVTRLQALEYIVNENVYRRVFDVFGVVPVVPGPLAAFRKKVLDEIGAYDSDTLTEDFDITVKALKTGKAVQALTDAFVYTEAPSNWRDFYRQRLRWNRGTFQNLFKHRNVFTNPRFGYTRDLTFPYVFLSMVFIPLTSVISLATVIMAIMLGFGTQVLTILAGFMLLEGTYSFLALQLDEEDMSLLIYSPFLVVGYKEIRHFIKLKSLIDVITRKDMEWGEITRTGKGS